MKPGTKVFVGPITLKEASGLNNSLSFGSCQTFIVTKTSHGPSHHMSISWSGAWLGLSSNWNKHGVDTFIWFPFISQTVWPSRLAARLSYAFGLMELDGLRCPWCFGHMQFAMVS